MKITNFNLTHIFQIESIIERLRSRYLILFIIVLRIYTMKTKNLSEFSIINK